jgi:hypothetical protein
MSSETNRVINYVCKSVKEGVTSKHLRQKNLLAGRQPARFSIAQNRL